MAAPTTYFVVAYDNEASGPFVAESTTLLTWTASSGYIVTVIDNGATGKLVVALYTGSIPTDGLTLTQGTTTADADGDGELLRYPAFFRSDVAVAASGAVTWTGKNLSVTHTFRFDGQTVNCSTGDIITFVDGQTCELIQVISDAGASGEYGVRWITDIDTEGYPEDNDTFTASPSGGNGAVDGLVHERAYRPLHIHRLLQDLSDDEIHYGDDVQAIYQPKPSARSTDDIITLLGGLYVNDEVIQHMYGGSISQTETEGNTLYSGLAVQVTDKDGLSEPVLIQNDAVVTEYWGNAFMPDSIKGNIRIMRKTRHEGVDIDGKRITGRLLEYQSLYFTAGTTLGTAETALALVAGNDGNNQTAVGTVAGAPYNTIVVTEGYQQINYNNGAGDTPYALKWDVGSATKPQSYERWKYIQRRGTAETLFGRNAQLVLGVTRDFAYNNEVGGPFSENEKIAWGTEIPYTGEALGPFTVGAVIEDQTTGAKGRILYLDDQGATGTLIVAQEGTTAFGNTNTINELGGTASATTGTVVTNAAAGTGLLIGLDDDGTTGYLYYQQLTGINPANGQTVFGQTSLATADVNGTINAYVNNNQFIGVFTGSDFQSNRGLGLDPSDAQANDKLLNLLGAEQSPPDNQQGVATGLVATETRIGMYPYDGVSTDVNGDPEPDFDEMAVTNTALTQGVSTAVDVGTGNIPNNTPATGSLRIERNAGDGGGYFLWAYSAHDGDDGFTMVGTAPWSANIGNNVMRALVDKVAAATSESFTAPYTAPPMEVVIIAKQGGGTTARQPVFQTATFGATGFSSGVNLIDDE
jgi:hypothetical protein